MKIQQTGKQRGFSLVELLLTLVLILCLAAATVFSYTALNRSANLDEGLNRLESLIRFAQAEAATSGKKVRLQFSAARPSEATTESGETVELRDIEVLWEPDMLNAPGVFESLTNKPWSETMVNELVGVTEVRSIQPEGIPLEPEAAYAQGLTQSAAPETEADPEQGDGYEPEFPSITFYPDGSCDSAEIILASRNSEDERRMQVRLSGILGSVSSKVVEADSYSTDTFDGGSEPLETERKDWAPETTSTYPAEESFAILD